ncbi:alkaline ceramidase ydc1 [Blastocladiella emersonii ATCC 22665]|nr:alkaline ceramidase ydc1 [Blastocladiella emersonii ATCC 22665]
MNQPPPLGHELPNQSAPATHGHRHTHTHTITRFGPGIWGPATASVDWCELDHVVTPYIAEFFNATSNAVTIAVAATMFIKAREFGLERRYGLAALFLMLVGIGSFCFHATLQYEAQLLDELPMIYMELVFSYLAIENTAKKRYAWLPAAMWISGIAYSILHVTQRLVVTFHIVFGVLIAPILILPYPFTKHEPKLRRSFLLGFLTLTLSFVAWELDQIFCEYLEPLHLHAVWHVGTATAGAMWLTSMMYIRMRYVHRVPGVTLQTKWGFIPFIRVPPKLHASLSASSSMSASTSASMALHRRSLSSSLAVSPKVSPIQTFFALGGSPVEPISPATLRARRVEKPAASPS